MISRRLVTLAEFKSFNPPHGIDELVVLCQSELAAILNIHAPIMKPIVIIRPWYSEEIELEKRKRESMKHAS